MIAAPTPTFRYPTPACPRSAARPVGEGGFPSSGAGSPFQRSVAIGVAGAVPTTVIRSVAVEAVTGPSREVLLASRAPAGIGSRRRLGAGGLRWPGLTDPQMAFAP